MKRILFLLSVLLTASAAHAAETPAALVGQFGFDWLRPGVAQCETITDKMAALFKTCTYFAKGSTGSFTGDADFHKCTVSKKSEYMIYKTKERCAQELETMQANAP